MTVRFPDPNGALARARTEWFVLALAAAAMPWCGIATASCAIALTATLKAEREGRTAAMLLAVSIAVALAPAGLIATPLALGTAIRRRAWRDVPIPLLAGAATLWLTGGWSTAGSLPNLVELACRSPDLIALVAAAGIGAAACIAADASARRPSARVVLLGTLALACIVPTAPIVLVAAILILYGSPARFAPRVRAANDNPVLPLLRLRAQT